MKINKKNFLVTILLGSILIVSDDTLMFATNLNQSFIIYKKFFITSLSIILFLNYFFRNKIKIDFSLIILIMMGGGTPS